MLTQPPIWSTNWIGIPFVNLGRNKEVGLDCYGLVRAVLRERAGIELRSYDTVSESDYRSVSGAIEDAKQSQEWTPIEAGKEAPLDVVEMVFPALEGTRVAFIPLHVGIVVAPGWLLHTEYATGSRLSAYNEQRMASRIIGFWRHRELLKK